MGRREFEKLKIAFAAVGAIALALAALRVTRFARDAMAEIMQEQKITGQYKDKADVRN